MIATAYSLPNRVSDLPAFALDHEIIISPAEMGAWTFLCRDPKLHERVCGYFGRPEVGSVIKVWQYPFPNDFIHDCHWGRYFNMDDGNDLDVLNYGALLPALKAQNFASRFGLAPSIYGLFVLRSSVGSLHPAILSQDANCITDPKQQPDHEIFKTVKEFCSKYGLRHPFGDLERNQNIVQGVWVDWQYSGILNGHLDFLRDFYLKNTQFGNSKYQTAPAIGVDVGIRDTVKRVSDLGLDRFEFRGTTILDIGCNGGQFLNYAAARGARFGCGVDWPSVAQAADYVSSYLGHFNLRYIGAPLHEHFPAEARRAPYDLILLLSMTTHIGTPDYLHDLGKRLIVEVNHPHQVADVEAKLAPNWWYQGVGKAGDHGDRQIFHAVSKRFCGANPFEA